MHMMDIMQSMHVIDMMLSMHVMDIMQSMRVMDIMLSMHVMDIMQSVHMITCEGHLQAVVVVHHGRDAIKAEAVKLVLVHPPAGVGQQEAQSLPCACTDTRTTLITEAPRGPSW